MDITFSKLQDRIFSILIELKLSPDLVGFNYIFDCIIILMGMHGKRNRSFQSMYQDIAKRHNVGSYCVEQGIHTALDIIWHKGKSKALNKIIGLDIYGEYDKPSATQFLTILAERLMQEYYFTNGGSLIDLSSLFDHNDED